MGLYFLLLVWACLQLCVPSSVATPTPFLWTQNFGPRMMHSSTTKHIYAIANLSQFTLLKIDPEHGIVEGRANLSYTPNHAPIISPDGALVMVNAFDGLEMWELPALRYRWKIPKESNCVRVDSAQFATTSDGTLIVIAMSFCDYPRNDYRVLAWDAQFGKQVWKSVVLHFRWTSFQLSTIFAFEEESGVAAYDFAPHADVSGTLVGFSVDTGAVVWNFTSDSGIHPAAGHGVFYIGDRIINASTGELICEADARMDHFSMPVYAQGRFLARSLWRESFVAVMETTGKIVWSIPIRRHEVNPTYFYGSPYYARGSFLIHNTTHFAQVDPVSGSACWVEVPEIFTTVGADVNIVGNVAVVTTKSGIAAAPLCR